MTIPQPTLICAMCGQPFDPTDQASCQGCPFQPGCALVRCPACGYETVNPDQSRLAQLFRRIFLHPSSQTQSSPSRNDPL